MTTTIKRQLTEAAVTAKAIKKELKDNFPKIKFSVRSENFSMGDAVAVRWTDGPTTQHVQEFVNKYQYGSFNSMEDMYENTNSREDLPQVKFVQTSREMSEEAREEIYKDIKEETEGMNQWDLGLRIRHIFSKVSFV